MSSTDPLIGTKLGSHEIIAAIGQGGMARIYKGFHAELHRYTAIKVVHWGLQEDPEFTERFRREAQAIAILRHPNIVQIFDFGQHSSGYYMVMEFIEGSDLAVILRQHRERKELFPRDKTIRVIRDVAAALDYAHSRGVIHRDVKPSNIMITPEGQPILTDFGLVMLPTHKSQATIGNTFGTPHYVAPEQAISSAAAVSASDIYSLGVILYEIATGQLPFDDESPLSVALKHISDTPPPPTSINPNLPLDVSEVIMRALAKDPTDRFATAGDLASALEMSWSEGGATIAAKGRRAAPPVLPAGVPSPAAVPKMTLPNSAALAPAAGVTDISAGQQQERKPRLLGWWPMALGGLVIALGGAWGLFSFFNLSSAQPAPTPTTVVVSLITPTSTPTTTPTATPSPAPTSTPLPPTATPLPPSATPTSTFTASPSPTDTPTPTATSTSTFTPVPPTLTPTSTPTPTETSTPTPLPTATPPPAPVATLTPTPGQATTREQLTGKILFKTDRAGLVQIYVMEADGSNQRPFEDINLYTQLEAELPLSPSKQEQVVVRGEGQLDLWRSNLITGQELRVTSTGKPEYDPAWSPVDNRIVYVSEETGNGDIYVLNLDGSANDRLTFNTDNFDKHPTWAPDGSKIAFWSDISFNKKRQIWLIDLATKTLKSLSDNPYNDWDPVWVH
ncbi:MAG: protein kinase [Anaerolineae bacterium]